jgi:hypothetical protein
VLRVLDDAALRAQLVERGAHTALRFDCDVEAAATSRLFAASIGVDPDAIAAGFAAERP